MATQKKTRFLQKKKKKKKKKIFKKKKKKSVKGQTKKKPIFKKKKKKKKKKKVCMYRLYVNISPRRRRSLFSCTMTIATPFSGAANSVTSAKVVLITGVSKGLGRALSLEMAKRGHTVIGCARTQEKLTALQSELSSPENHLLLTADVVIAALLRTLSRLNN